VKSCVYCVKRPPKKEKEYYAGDTKWRCEVKSFG
jgi:hypothetical protein